MRLIKLAGCIAIVFILGGCATLESIQETLNNDPIAKARHRKARAERDGDRAEVAKQDEIIKQLTWANMAWWEKLPYLMGKSKEEVTLELGAPTEIKEIDSLTVFRYVRGVESQGSATAFGNSAFGSSSSSVFGSDLVFKNDKLIKYGPIVQR